MKVFKSISYCVPSSPRAQQLGCAKTGGFYVEQVTIQPFTAIGYGNEAFERPDDPGLLRLYREADGEHSRLFLRHGNEISLRALGLR